MRVNISDLTIKITYEVALSDLEVPKEVYDQLVLANEHNNDISYNSEWAKDAYNWICNNIEESDAYNWNAEVSEIYE